MLFIGLINRPQDLLGNWIGAWLLRFFSSGNWSELGSATKICILVNLCQRCFRLTSVSRERFFFSSSCVIYGLRWWRLGCLEMIRFSFVRNFNWTNHRLWLRWSTLAIAFRLGVNRRTKSASATATSSIWSTSVMVIYDASTTSTANGLIWWPLSTSTKTKNRSSSSPLTVIRTLRRVTHLTSGITCVTFLDYRHVPFPEAERWQHLQRARLSVEFGARKHW